MPTSPERLEREIVALTGAGLAPDAYRRAALDRIVSAVPVTAACLAAVDPATLVPVAHTSQGILRRGAGRLYQAEWTEGDVASHRSLATGAPARVLSQVTGGELDRSLRYRTLLAAMGWKHELRAAVADRGGTWGFIHLYRGDHLADFTADELELVGQIGSAVAQGLRSTMLAGVPHVVPGTRAPAVLVLDERYRVIQATPGSETLLAALRDDETPTDETPEPLVALAVMASTVARRTPAGEIPQVPRLQVPTADGDWLTLYASVLQSSCGSNSQVAITSSAASSADLLHLALLVVSPHPGRARRRHACPRRPLHEADRRRTRAVTPHRPRSHARRLHQGRCPQPPRTRRQTGRLKDLVRTLAPAVSAWPGRRGRLEEPLATDMS